MASSKQARSRAPGNTVARKPPAARPPQASGAGPAARPPQTRRARDRARARELALERASAEPAAAAGPPFWLRIATLILAIGGLGVSVYMTIEHFTGNTTLACSVSGTDNCLKVTTSPESMVFGVIPVAVLGLAFFAFMVAVTTPMAWQSRRREIALARLLSVVVGVGFILYLIYVELIQVKAICLWCTSVHVMTFLLFVLVAFSAAIWGLPDGDARRVSRR